MYTYLRNPPIQLQALIQLTVGKMPRIARMMIMMMILLRKKKKIRRRKRNLRNQKRIKRGRSPPNVMMERIPMICDLSGVIVKISIFSKAI